jgi:hypothetical protein
VVDWSMTKEPFRKIIEQQKVVVQIKRKRKS